MISNWIFIRKTSFVSDLVCSLGIPVGSPSPVLPFLAAAVCILGTDPASARLHPAAGSKRRRGPGLGGGKVGCVCGAGSRFIAAAGPCSPGPRGGRYDGKRH